MSWPHTDRDLAFFADAHTRAAYDAIDGATPLGGIHGATAELFGRLWWHDLVMIDASRAR